MAETWHVYDGDPVLAEREGAPDLQGDPGAGAFDLVFWQPGDAREARWSVSFREAERDLVGEARWWDEAMACRPFLQVRGERIGDLP